jgi:dihydrofolate reductase
MRKLIEATFVSLDGVVGSAEQWAFPYFNVEETRQQSLTKLMDCDVFLLGRETFEMLYATGSALQGDPYFDRVNSMPKFVASRTLHEVPSGATLMGDNIAEEVADLKRRPGKSIMKYGNGNFDRTLIAHNLIDEFHFSIFPMIIGKGRRLFEGIDTSHLNLKLSGTKQFSNGVVTHSYVNA